MKTISSPLAVSLMIVAFVLGLVGGYYVSPSYQQTMFVKDEMDLGQADTFVDLRYINRMAAHHTGAILLANQIAQQSQKRELLALAADIQKGEPVLIEELYSWKKEWYKDGRRVADPKVVQLGSYDNTFDLRALNALIAHHEMGIKMTQEVRLKSSRKEILDNADAVENFLTGSLVTLKKWREEWFSVNY